MKKQSRQSSLVHRGEQPEGALWRNVLLQALADATLRLPSSQSLCFGNEMEIIRGQARRWIKAQREDFQLVCELAGLEASRVHAFAMAQIRKSIEEEHERTARENFVKGSEPSGVVQSFLECQGDRTDRATRDSSKIDFLKLEI